MAAVVVISSGCCLELKRIIETNLIRISYCCIYAITFSLKAAVHKQLDRVFQLKKVGMLIMCFKRSGSGYR